MTAGGNWPHGREEVSTATRITVSERADVILCSAILVLVYVRNAVALKVRFLPPTHHGVLPLSANLPGLGH